MRSSGYNFMSRENWTTIYDLARYNGIAVHQLLNEVHAENPDADELEIYYACRRWSEDRTRYPSIPS
jgi:predicted DNA-binding ribbon-helix-helix protein